PAPVVEPSTALPVEELPLFTDSMLGERPDSQPALDAAPPPIVDRSHGALAPDLSFRDAPLSMVESLHEPEGTNGHGSAVDDFQSSALDPGGHRLSMDDFTGAVHDVASSLPQDHSMTLDEPVAAASHGSGAKPYEPELDMQEVFAREAAEVPVPSRPAPFE